MVWWIVDGRNSCNNHVVKVELVRNCEIMMDFSVVKASRDLEEEGNNLMGKSEM